MQYRQSVTLTNRIRLALGGGVLGLGAIFAAPVGAGDLNSKVPIDIPQQTLDKALASLAAQADLQILFKPEIAERLRSERLSGSYSGSEALQRLLAGSNLEYVVNGSDTVVIRARNTPAPATSRIEQSPAMAGAASGRGEVLRRIEVEEIIVTSQKRVERLQDVPVAVTVLSGATLSAAGVRQTTDLVNLTPSLTFAQGASPSNTNLRIRGIGTALFGQGTEPSVSVVVDGIVLARSSQGFSDLADIERVEVLRGPQGTLFGKNSVAGLINVITKRPSEVFEADADVTVAEQEEYRVRGSVSGPVNDTMGYRLTGYYNDVGGHIRNVTLNQNVNGSESWGARGKYEWDATERLNLLVMADYRESETLCCSSQYLSVVNNPLLQQVLLPVVADFNNRKDTENQLTFFNTEQKTFSVEGNLDLDAVTLTSLTAYQDFFLINNQPIDRLNTPTPLTFPVTNGSFDVNGGTIDIGQFSQELRVTSPGAERFNYVAGLYYLDMDLERTFQRRSGGCAPGGNAPVQGQPCRVPLYRSQAGFSSETGTKNAAVFGQMDFALVGNLSALLGARYQWEEISYAGTRTDTRLVPGDQPLVGFPPSSGSGKSDDTVVTGKAGLQYDFSEDAQAYLTWSTGHKGRGYETEFAATFESQTPIEPEDAKAWELGFKTQLWEDILVLNTALFYAEYDDLQVQANRGNPDTGLIRFQPTNAGSSTTQGAELELTWRPMGNFSLNGGVTYLDTSVDVDGLNCALSDQAAAPVIVGAAPDNTCYRLTAGGTPIQNVSDGQFPNAPEWRGILTARYELPLGATGWQSFMQLTGTSQSKMNFVIEQDPLLDHPSYTLLDASIGFLAPDNRYRITLFAKNILDEHYVTLMARSSTLTSATFSPNSVTGNVPKDANRYFGATIGVSF